MVRFRLIQFSWVGLLALLLAPALYGQQHFQFEVTDNNMSVLIMTATLDGEELVAGDEVGVFTPRGDCAGAEVVTRDGFPIGLAAWGQEGNIPGFRAGEDLAFRVWDHQADEEWEAEVFNVEEGRPVYEANGFVVLSLRAFRGEGEPDIELSENAHHFGEVVIGNQATWDFTVTNRGRATLEIRNMTLTDGPFSVNFEGQVSLERGEEASWTVTFAPQEAGEFQSGLTIVSNDPDEEEVTITLIGVGRVAGGPHIVLSTNRLNYGRVVVGQERTLTLGISNTGESPLEIQNMEITGEQYRVEFEEAFTIEPGGRANVPVTFAPQEVGDYREVLTITSNDPQNERVEVLLIGQGIEAGEPPQVAVYEDEHFFGNVSLGRTARWRLVVTNVGDEDLWVYSVISDHDAFRAIFPRDSQRVRRGDYLYVPIEFTPQQEGFYDGTLTVVSSDPDEGEFTVMVGGLGTRDDGMHFRYFNTDVNHSLLVTEVTLDGQRVARGTEVGVFTGGGFCAGAGVVEQDGRVGIAAFGDDAATDIIDGFRADEPFRFFIWDAARGVEVPAVAQFEEGPEAFSPNDISVLTLSARYVPPPDIELSARLYRFGQVRVGESEDWVLRIVNNGRGNLQVEAVESDLDVFTTDFDQPFNLGFLEGRDITVTFAPQEQESYWGRLTVRSNDPVDSVLYVDLFGVGVEEVREPQIVLSRPNYFFGVRRVGGQYNYVLTISNQGGGVLLLDSVRVEGAGFSTDWQEGGRQINPNGAINLTITFSPQQANLYRGNIHIYSDDPNNAHIIFPVGGVGTQAQTRFNAFDSGVRHSLLITRAVIITPNNQENLLTPGDEVAVFTTWGLCAGAVAVQEEGAALGLIAYGDNPDYPFDVGFQVNEPFTFRYWDHATRTEVPAEPEWVEGPRVFNVNGFSRLTLTGRTEVEAAQISVDPMVQQFGPVRVGEQASRVYRVSNIGGVNLTIQRVTSNLAVFTTNFGNQQRVLQPGEGFDLTVIFAPRQPISYEGIITIHSDDPRRPQFNFNAAGMGSEYPGHFVYYQTGTNHSILIQEFLMGGGPAAIGDEIGVFTEAGMCAGAVMVEEPGERLGLAAWGDEPETRIVVEGFQNGEEMSLRVWDASQEREYRPEVQIEEGEMNFEVNGFTVLARVSVPNVFSIIPIQPITVSETDTVRFTLRLSNPPGNMRFAFERVERLVQNQWRADSLQGRGQVTFRDNQNNTADFQWITNYEAAGQWRLWFRAFNDEVSDRTGVLVTVRNVNRAPQIVRRFPDDQIVIQEDAAMATVALLDTIFEDPDRDALTFSFEPRLPNLVQEIRVINNRPNYRIQPAANFSGQVRCRLIADDGVQGMPGRDGNRALRGVEERGGLGETGIWLGNPALPRRDAITTYEFTVVVQAVNDPPRIRQPADADVFNVAVDEGQQLVVNFSADDVDHQANQLRWTIVDRGNLPDEGPQFVDNQDGTARLTWTPNFQNQGQYTPLFRVTDPDGGTDQIRVNITVRDVNRPPQVRQPIPDYIVANNNALVEDQERQVLAVLNEVFEDPDGGQLAYALVDNPAQLQLQIAQNSELSAQPQANFYRLDPALRVTVRATDPGNASATVSFLVQVVPVNDPPTVRNPIPDWTRAFNRAVPEDQAGRRNIVSLELVFDDVDDPPANRRYEIVQAPAELQLQIAGARPNQLSYQLVADYNTWRLPDSTAWIVVACIDTSRASARDTFRFEVTAVNDPVRAFNLVSPQNNYSIPYDPDSLGVLTFSWTSAVPNPWELDTTRYFVAFQLDQRQDTFAVRIPLLDTLWRDIPFQAILDSITGQDRRSNRERAHTLTWWVWARDDISALRAANAPYRFFIPPLEVRQMMEPVLPERFYLTEAYPNPFNARTMLRFGIPQAEMVEVTVWDMHGRKIADLSPGNLVAGSYEILWDATGTPAGIYLIKVQAGDLQMTRKAVLLR